MKSSRGGEEHQHQLLERRRPQAERSRRHNCHYFTTGKSLPAAGNAKVVSPRATVATLELHLGFTGFNYALLRLRRLAVLALAGGYGGSGALRCDYYWQLSFLGICCHILIVMRQRERNKLQLRAAPRTSRRCDRHRRKCRFVLKT